jgi:hypothetical protein
MQFKKHNCWVLQRRRWSLLVRLWKWCPCFFQLSSKLFSFYLSQPNFMCACQLFLQHFAMHMMLWWTEILGFLYYVQECVPIMFSKGSSSSHYMPQDVPNCTTLLFHTLCPKLSFQLSKTAKQETPSFFNRKFYIGEPPKFQFSFVVRQSKWFIAKKKKKRKEKENFKLGEPPHVCDGNKSWI